MKEYADIVFEANDQCLFQKPTIVFGAGDRGREAYEWLREFEIDKIAFVDSNPDLIGMKLFDDIVYGVDFIDSNWQILISSSRYYTEIESTIVDIECCNVFNYGKLISGYYKDIVVKGMYGRVYKKSSLIIYITRPFFSPESRLYSHQNQQQVRWMARMLWEKGFNVDIIDYNSVYSVKDYASRYDLIVDMSLGTNNLMNTLKSEACFKIAYITGSNPRFSNAAERERLEALKERRGVRLPAVRNTKAPPKWISEYNVAVFIGNEHNLDTFKDYGLPKTYLINNTGYALDYSSRENHERPYNFMYIGGAGQVHKGLDLLLEVFSSDSFPCHLYIVSNLDKDFSNCYYNELNNCSNIHVMGHLSIFSELFTSTAEKCAYMIYPSCSEGQSGAVLTAMSAGMIPIVSEYSGFDEEDCIVLKDCTIDTIRDTVLEYKNKDSKWVRYESERARNLISQKFNKDCYLRILDRVFSECKG